MHVRPTQIVWLWLFFCLLWAFSIQSSASAPKLVTGDHYYPFAAQSAPQGGWSVKVVQAVLQHMELDAEIEVLPWGRGFKWTLENKYLGTFPYVRSRERETQFYFSKPINFVPMKLVVNKGAGIDSLADIHKKRFCFPRGYGISFQIDGLITQYELRLHRAKNNPDCIALLNIGRTDVAVVNDYNAHRYLENLAQEHGNVGLLDEEIGGMPLHLIVSRSYPGGKEWLNRFDRALTNLSDSGALETLNHEYMLGLSTHQAN